MDVYYRPMCSPFMARHFATRCGMPATRFCSVAGLIIAQADLRSAVSGELLDIGTGLCFGELRFQDSPQIFYGVGVR